MIKDEPPPNDICFHISYHVTSSLYFCNVIFIVFFLRMEAKENSDICKLGCRGIWLVRIDRVG